MELTKKKKKRTSSKGAGLGVTREDVQRAVPEPHNNKLLAAAFAAVAYSPLLLVYDVLQYGANGELQNAQCMLEVSVAVSCQCAGRADAAVSIGLMLGARIVPIRRMLSLCSNNTCGL